MGSNSFSVFVKSIVKNETKTKRKLDPKLFLAKATACIKDYIFDPKAKKLKVAQHVARIKATACINVLVGLEKPVNTDESRKELISRVNSSLERFGMEAYSISSLEVPRA